MSEEKILNEKKIIINKILEKNYCTSDHVARDVRHNIKEKFQNSGLEPEVIETLSIELQRTCMELFVSGKFFYISLRRSVFLKTQLIVFFKVISDFCVSCLFKEIWCLQGGHACFI